MKIRSRYAAVIALSSAAVLLSACSSTSSSESSSEAAPAASSAEATMAASAEASAPAATGDSVMVDVGTGTPVELPTGPLKVGVFMNAMSNKWQQTITDHEIAKGKEYGWDVKIQDFNWDQQAMLNAMQDAVTNKTYDAWIVNPIDGNASCKMITETAPQANILVGVTGTAICGRDANGLDDFWSPGTYMQTSVAPSKEYLERWYQATADANPGPQKVAMVYGPSDSGAVVAAEKVGEEFMKANPDFQIVDKIYGDYTAPTAFQGVQAYLQAHPDTDILMSIYSPDVSQGMVKAVKSLGLEGKVKLTDMGGSEFTIQEIKDGTIQLTLPYYPGFSGDSAIQAFKDAQDGLNPPLRVYDEVPGGMSNAPVIDSSNVDQFTPQY